jgi:hypothetical protein
MRLLSELAEPASAAMLAARLGVPRQKITYHLKALEAHHLVQESATRSWGGLRERLFVASADTYVVSPAAFGPVAPDPARTSDRLSASYLIALAARAVGEVGSLLRRARAAQQPLPSLSIDAEIRFRSAAERAAFTSDLTETVKELVARYHDDGAPGGRAHRLIILAHPVPLDPPPPEETAKERTDHARSDR